MNKRNLIISSCFGLLILLASSFTYRFLHLPLTRVVYTSWYPTPPLDKITGGTGCDMSIDGGACYKPTFMTQLEYDPHWGFSGQPTLEYLEPAVKGSSTVWNHLDRPWQKLISERRITVIQNSQHQIQVKLLTGSGTVHVRLKCTETYSEATIPPPHPIQPAKPGKFTVQFYNPNGSNGPVHLYGALTGQGANLGDFCSAPKAIDKVLGVGEASSIYTYNAGLVLTYNAYTGSCGGDLRGSGVVSVNVNNGALVAINRP